MGQTRCARSYSISGRMPPTAEPAIAVSAHTGHDHSAGQSASCLYSESQQPRSMMEFDEVVRLSHLTRGTTAAGIPTIKPSAFAGFPCGGRRHSAARRDGMRTILPPDAGLDHARIASNGSGKPASSLCLRRRGSHGPTQEQCRFLHAAPNSVAGRARRGFGPLSLSPADRQGEPITSPRR